MIFVGAHPFKADAVAGEIAARLLQPDHSGIATRDQGARHMTAQVLTANRLLDGEVVFLGTRGWVEISTAATVADDAGQAKALEALGKQSMAVNEVVDAYLIDVVARARAGCARSSCASICAPSARPCAPTSASRPARRETPMYRYDEFDRQFVLQRTAQFNDQVRRRLIGELSEDEFKPLRLKNGLYLQLHAYMLRIAIPYGTLSSRQLRKLADIADKYDRGYGHFTTRQNLQLNWPELKDVPDILAELAEVEMHCIQTSGNCIRNVTSDHFAGVAADEVADPRPWAELLRQWSTLHPEFSYLPRKFKIAVTASPADRAAVRAHDIGLVLKKDDEGELGFEVLVGGGLGRTPMIGKMVREFLPTDELLPTARRSCASTTASAGATTSTRRGSRSWSTSWACRSSSARSRPSTRPATMPRASRSRPRSCARIQAYFAPPAYESLPDRDPLHDQRAVRGGRVRSLGAQQHGAPQGAGLRHRHRLAEADRRHSGRRHLRADADVAALADEFSHGEIRVTHEQNLVLPNVRSATCSRSGTSSRTPGWRPPTTT